MINFVILEDNKLHMKNTEKIIIKYMMKNKFEFEISMFEKETPELIEIINKNEQNNIYILDFELPNTNALDISRKIRKNDWVSPIIILTAHGGMAFESFKQRLQILDFVSKQYQASKNLVELFDICMKQLKISKSLKFTYNYIDYNIPFEKILYIYRDTVERKIIIVTNTKEYKIRMSMKKIKELLPKDFKFCHKACIINTARVESYDWKNFVVTFDNGLKTNLISKTHKKEFMQK